MLTHGTWGLGPGTWDVRHTAANGCHLVVVKPAMMDFTRDLRQGFLLLWRAPGFAVTAILTLALGIGATTALFTAVNAVLLDPLPFPDSNKLIQVWRSELPALTYGSASDARYLDWRRHQRVFTDLGAWAPRGLTIAGPEGPERAPGAMASASFFGVIGAPPVIGRYFSDEEDRQGGERVVVISEGLWRRRYQQSASVLGQNVQIDGAAVHGDRCRAVGLLGNVAARRLAAARPVCQPGESQQQLPALVRTAARRDDARERASRPRRFGRADVARPRHRQVLVHRAAVAPGDHRERHARPVDAPGGDDVTAADRVHQRREPAPRARGGS